ncbi:hypothetical protein EVJ58_g10073 [Rhodofomes roseus]|uniref:Homeobox domain-containing protein n=1 Tax=Rhodofomes roseus TaxID=34475 RepID=A0A4Y9XUW7_9APHY|nr:hypothetical protein EVJ58_g10073 [Rhodofomes roseus]
MRPTTRSQVGAPPSEPAPSRVQGIPAQSTNDNTENVFEAGNMKEKKPRHRITRHQLDRLEALYEENTHPSRQVKQSLANDVGLPLKNITIWFQNKRQTNRRKSRRFTNREETGRIVEPAPLELGPSTRLLLGLTPEPASSEKESPSVRKDRSSRERTATPTPSVSAGRSANATPSLRREEAYAQDIWAHMPSSPPTPALVHTSIDTASPSMLLFEDDVFGPVIASHQVRTPIAGMRKPDLEWACARAEKRSRIRTSACRSQWSPDISSDLDVLRTGKHRVELDEGPDNSKSQTFYPDIPIPAEYRALFPVDMIEGASLLLGLKHAGGGRT